MNKGSLLAALICSSSAIAGQADTTRQYDLGKRIFIEPLALIDVYNQPSLRVGLEWPVIKNYLSVFGVWGQYYFTDAKPYYGRYYRAGLRLYTQTIFKRRLNDQTSYLSVHVFYKSQLFEAYDNIKVNNEPGPEVTYDVRKESKGFHLELGTQFAFKRVCFEPYIGGGIRESTVRNNAGDSLLAILYHYHEGQATNIGNSNKWVTVLPSMALGVRLSYLFKSRPCATCRTYKRIKKIIP